MADLAELHVERERAFAYDLPNAVALLDAAIARASAKESREDAGPNEPPKRRGRPPKQVA